MAKTSKFDINFSKTYKELSQKRNDVLSQIQQLNTKYTQEEWIANREKIAPLYTKAAEYKKAINSLLNKDTQEKAFFKYSKKLFNASLKIIVNTPELSNFALNFSTLSDKQKQNFGQIFLDRLVKKYKLTPVSFEITDEVDADLEAHYNYDNKKISAKQDSEFIKSFDLFIGEILHEFTHHIYHYNPEFSPIGEQKAFYATRYGQATPGMMNLDEYKQQPFEAPAYFIQEYFMEHKFVDTVIALIQNRQCLLDTVREK